MPDRLKDGIIYYRAKGGALGALVTGALLLVFTWIVLTQEGIAGIPFSRGLPVMSTYLALPVGSVLVLANLQHALDRGPTLVADEDGITILFTRRPIGVIRWTEIARLRPVKRQGRWHLGVVLEDPEFSLSEYRDLLGSLLGRVGPADAHLKIDGKMLDDEVTNVVRDLEEMQRRNSWRSA